MTGIVYSMMTAAMWQNFCARLPYLYDPWSERLPAAPTLMHAMVAVALLVEGGALMTRIAQALAGRDMAAVVGVLAYGVSAACVSVGVARFLANRGVCPAEIWRWQPADPGPVPPRWRLHAPGRRFLLASLLIGYLLGLALGLAGRGYLAILHHSEWLGTMLDKARAQMDSVPHRALDREGGGWRAVVGSAAFFAIHHPPLAWLPVGLVRRECHGAQENRAPRAGGPVLHGLQRRDPGLTSVTCHGRHADTTPGY